MAYIKIETDIKKAQKKLAELGKGLDSSQAGKLIGMALVEWIDENFRSQGQLGGRKWKAIKPNTVISKATSEVPKGSTGILENKGALKRSFDHYRVHRTSLGLQVVVGSGLGSSSINRKPIASFHEFGTKPYTIRPKNKKVLSFMTVGGRIACREVHHPGLPKRPILPSKLIAKEVSKKELKEYLEKVISKANRI